jgi:hypothetical protein
LASLATTRSRSAPSDCWTLPHDRDPHGLKGDGHEPTRLPRSKIRLNKTFLEGTIQEVLIGKKGSYDAFGLFNPFANPFRQPSAYDFGVENT